MTGDKRSVARGDEPLAMRRGLRLGLYLLGIGLWLSGGLWLICHYFGQRQGEFGMGPHPLEPWLLKLHGACAFGVIWALGLLWGVHIAPGLAAGERRRSGAVMLGLALWLVLSGYLLYYVGQEWLRAVTGLLHWAVGLLIPVFLFAHRLAPRDRGTQHAVVETSRRAS
jgi:hypothetical protein